MKRMVAAAATAGVLAGAGEGAARAGGLFAGDLGSQGQQRAGAFVAKADDPSAIYYNPAGLVKARLWQVFVGANVLEHWQRFDRAGVYELHDQLPAGEPQPPYVGLEHPAVEDGAPAQAVPFLAATRGLDRFAIGAGLFAPQGVAGRDLPAEVQAAGGVTAPAPQRYDILSQKAIVAFPSVAGAARVLPWLDVGARASWGVATMEARTTVWGAIGNQEEDPGFDADFRVKGTDAFVPGWAAGALARPTRWLEVGLAVTGAAHIRVEGDSSVILGPALSFGDTPNYVEPVDDAYARCARGGTQDALKGCVALDLPLQASVGARYVLRDAAGRERADVELDLRWEDWSSASDIRVIVDGRDHVSARPIEEAVIRHGFRDVYAVRLGGAYRLPVARDALELRAGVSYDTAAAPLSWTRLDIDGTERLQGAVGVAYEFSRWRVDLGGAYVHSSDRTVTDVPLGDAPAVKDRVQPDPVQPIVRELAQGYDPMNAGTYTNGYAIVSAGVTASF